MKYRITARNIAPCHINLPASKSISNRAIIIGALAGCIDNISHCATCDDSRVMLDALSSHNDCIDIHAAGTAMRFLTALYSITPGHRTLTGCERMTQRPIGPLVDTLRLAGASISYIRNEGFPPIDIEGRNLHGGKLSIRGDISSQFISAILLVAPYMTHGVQLSIDGKITSRPYINLTIDLMRYYGASVTWNDNTICVEPIPYRPRHIDIESDWSAASYWYEIAITSNTAFTLNGLSQHSQQGDKRIAQYCKAWGVNTAFDNNGATITPTTAHDPQECISLDLQDEPDLALTIIMTCALNNRHFSIHGLHNLSIKECDRVAAIIEEAAKLGYHFTQPHRGTIEWHGQRCNTTSPIVIDTHNDHRIAMAIAPAALRHDNIWIENPQVTDKSYPTFWDDLQRAGFDITSHT